MKNWIITAAVSLMVFTGGCVTTLQVSVEPNIGKMSFEKRFPLKGACHFHGYRNYRYKALAIFLPSPVANGNQSVPLSCPLGKPLPRQPIRLFHSSFKRCR